MTMLLMPTSSAGDFDNWEDGDEVDITGHSFDEEYWTAEDVSNTTEDGKDVSFTVSYINYSGVQVFFVAFNSISDENGTGTLPYQMYGLHYFTPEGREIFIVATFAFLMVYNDTNTNNIPDNNEDKFIVQPFGLGNESWTPETTVTSVEKVGEGHYRFGITYENMYGGIFLGKLPWFIAKFTEFTITYDVQIDEETGEVTTETYYTLGQVVEAYQWFVIYWEVDPSEVISENMSIAAVHHVTVFASNYKLTSGGSGNTLNKDETAEVEEVTVRVGDNDERAFRISLQGTFDLLDEGTDPHTLVEDDKTAYNIIVRSTLADVIIAVVANPLFAISLGASARLASIFGYGLSDHIQDEYTSPRDLAERGLNPFSPSGFKARSFWYAVVFPSWQGYRVEHDPTYTAYFGDGTEAVTDEEGPCASGALILAGAFCIPTASAVSKKRKGKGKKN
jgi:hypothetical protein